MTILMETIHQKPTFELLGGSFGISRQYARGCEVMRRMSSNATDTGGERRRVGKIGLMEMHCSGLFRDCRRGKDEGGCRAGCWPPRPTGNGASHTKQAAQTSTPLRSFLRSYFRSLHGVSRKGRLFLRASRVTEP